MSFSERFHNTIFSCFVWIYFRFFHIPRQNEIAQKYFGHLGKLPSTFDLLKNISAILINTHRATIAPRPSMPGIVFIGGAHVKETKPLPNDIQTFLDDAEDGAIYLSFGTWAQSQAMPPERIEMILNALKQVKQ